jgi:uncharacterized protein YutE (UPF0331/DUF86 family)
VSDDRFSFLLGETQKFCKIVGLHEDLILEIWREGSDWAFILKIDAILETAAKEIITKGLKIELAKIVADKEGLKDFIYALPMSGRTSIVSLLKVAKCSDEEINFIESVRKLRNAFAHNIRNVDASLLSIILNHKEKSRLIKFLCAIENYDEADLIKTFESDGGQLRFGILDSAMRFLTLGYHVALK